MNCLNWDEFKNEPCNGTAQYPYPCCSAQCGYGYKKRTAQLKAVLNDEVEWTDIMQGIKNWSIGTYLHYKNLA